MSAEDTIRASLRETARLLAEFPDAQTARVAKAASLMAEAVRSGRKVIWFGNGGSATQGQHMAAEFVGRFRKERRALPSISLTENMASVTAIGNDYAFERIFARQLEGLGQAGDAAVGLSTSGNSPNVLEGLRQAKALGLSAIGLTGGDGGRMEALCDVCICVPSTVTAHVQEAHLAIGHILCGLVEDAIK
ncbi:MAG: SIS domain-containing protein [Candidatus Omnitrophica bacterium]|nr:SIS domain-containing protein [Candidatus Omnitrophota bacterium]